MISANQLYKQSGSDKPFKLWLKENQDRGILDNHDTMYNANGQEDDIVEDTSSTTTSPTKKTPTTHQAKSKMGMVSLVGLVGVGLLLYGLTRASAE